VIVHDFDIKRVAVNPPKANPPLVVHADAVLTGTVTFQRLKAITGQRPKVIKPRRGCEKLKLTPRRPFEIFESSNNLIAGQPLGVAATESSNHCNSVYRFS